MRIRGFLLALACLLVAACGSQRDKAPPAHPAIWAIENRDGATIGWLFGTIHALPDNTRWESPVLDRALAQAGVLAVEVSDLSDKAAIGRIFNRLATNNPGPPLARRLDPKTRSRLAALFARDGIDSHHFDGMETWAAALAIAQLDQPGSADNGVDLALISRFAGRPVTELEGAARQLSVFDTLPQSEQRDLLKGVLDESDEPPQDRSELVRAWAAGDLKRLERLSRKGILADPELYDALLRNRNRDWASKIADMLIAGQQPFVAVGAAHMLGKDGLPALLTIHGYTVRRIQ